MIHAVITSANWTIDDNITPLQNESGLLYKVWAFPKPDAPFARWAIGCVAMVKLTLPDIDAPLFVHLTVAKNDPTDVQLAEMKEAILSLNRQTTRFEQDWLPRDSTGKLNRGLFKRMWRGGWRGVNKYEPS